MPLNEPKKQILVVEDEGLIDADIRRQLERLGYGVPAIASSGEEALRAARANTRDLVLMDIHLKGQADGIATARALKQAVQLPDVLSLFTGPGNNQGVIMDLVPRMRTRIAGTGGGRRRPRSFERIALRRATTLGLRIVANLTSRLDGRWNTSRAPAPGSCCDSHCAPTCLLRVRGLHEVHQCDYYAGSPRSLPHQRVS